MDNRMRETYSHIRESTVDHNVKHQSTVPNGPVLGVPVRVPRSSSVYSSLRVGSPDKDATLLENGLIVERVDLKKEEQEEKARARREEKVEKQRRRMSSVGANDAASAYSAPSPTFDSTAYLPNPSPYALTNHSAGQLSPASSKRFSVLSGGPASLRPSMNRIPSQISVVTQTPGKRRFFGYMSWNGQSQTSLALSGSMMDMQYVPRFE